MTSPVGPADSWALTLIVLPPPDQQMGPSSKTEILAKHETTIGYEQNVFRCVARNSFSLYQ